MNPAFHRLNTSISCQNHLEKRITASLLAVKVVRNKKLKILIIDDVLFVPPLDDNATLWNHKTWKYIAKTEVNISVMVIVSIG